MPGAGFDPTFADNCMGATISNDYNNMATLAGANFPVGTTTVVWTVTDAAGLTADCSIDIVISDVENPTIDCSAIDVTQDADAGFCSFTMPGTGFDPTFNDNCSATIAHDYNGGGSSLAGETFPLGTTTVIWTATDPAGLDATCTIDIVVTDVEAPVISCPADMDIDLADPNDCFADVNISITDISDACTSEADMDVDIMVQLETSPGVFAAAGAETASITYNATSMEFDIVTTNLRTGANLISS